MQVTYSLIDQEKWNRKVLNVYWIAVVMTIFTQLVNTLFTRFDYGYFLFNYVFVPTIPLLFIMIVAELLYCYSKYLNSVAIIIFGVLISTIIIHIHCTVEGITILYFFPLMIAISYFKRTLIVLVSLINLTSFILLYFLNPHLNSRLSMTELFTTVVIICGGAYLAVLIMTRGFQLLTVLEETNQAKQELLIKNIVMDKLTKMDLLTDLYNHNTFHEYLEKLIEQGRNYPISMQLALLDIDDFKSINDTYGHRAGDQVLKRVAKTITDSIGPHDFAARYGGEEFAVIFLENSPEESYRIAEKIRRQIALVKHKEAGDKSVTISIGLKNYHNEDRKEELFNRADALLYEAKRRGKNRTVMEE